ncbi:MAG: hypothetical protein LUH10_05950 [Tannerellaceae bacterium]|nr:hypothetical protein [Tannerellaceae bacterium]
MKDLLRLGITICLCLCVITACDDKDETPTPTPGEKAIQEIIDKLEELDNVTNFTAALKSIGSVDLENDQLTVFAVQDDGVKSTAGTKAALTAGEVKRHIAKGKHDVSKFTNGETKELESLAGDKIVIINDNGVITINGQEMEVGTPVTVGNSIIFIVPELIPAENPGISPVREITFRILETIRNWKEGQPDTIESEGAEITLFADVEGAGKLTGLGSVTTDANGFAAFSTTETGDLCFSVSSLYKTAFLFGYRVAGLFTTQEQIENSPSYETGTFLDNKYPGGIMLVDITGDGIINANDKTKDYLIRISPEQEGIIEVVITDDMDMEVNYEAALQKCEAELPLLFRDILAGAYTVDTSLVNGSAGFPTLNNIKNELEQLWHNSYTYIAAFNNNTILFEDAPDEYKNRWKNDYFSIGARNVAYIYSILTNYWGNVPLVTSTWLDVPPIGIRDIADYMDIFIDQAAENERYAIKALQNRMYLNPDVQQYERAFVNYREIIDSGNYNLSADPHSVTSDMQLMEVFDLAGDGILNDYPLCLPEIYLGCAETALELGNNDEASEYIRKIQIWLGEGSVSVSPAQLRSSLQDLSLRLLRNEDKTFMLYKRWDMLEEKLDTFCFDSRNRLLPFPASALDSNEHLQQYPGY